MIGRISQITRESENVYLVTLESANGDELGSYVFDVGLSLPVIAWSEEFDRYTGGPQRLQLRKLFEAISAFHEAQALELPAKKA